MDVRTLSIPAAARQLVSVSVLSSYTRVSRFTMAAPIPRDCIDCDGGCGQPSPSKRCSNCHTVFYCSRECQKKHWKEHKPYCLSLKEMQEEMMGLGKGAAISTETEINSECAICLENPIKRPIVLDACSHAFCSGCLIRWQQQLRPSESGGMDQNRSCPLCRSETTNIEESLLSSAKLCAARADRPNCSPEDQVKYREQALADLEKVLDVENPNIQAFFSKTETLISLGEGKAALECIDHLVQLNQERGEKLRSLQEMIARADAAEARGDENAEDLKQAVVQMIEDKGLPPNSFRNSMENRFDIQLLRAEVYIVLEEWKEAIKIYMGMLEAMEGPEDGTPVQQRKVFMGISRCFYECGDYDRSISAATAVLEMNRHFPGAHKYKALSEKAKGDIDEAIRTMNRAVLYETPWDEENKADVMQLYEALCSEKNS